ncbi:hypothetical protein D9615_000157 [Tricholomella constricta]|uniref:Uncharacterized protein n=1 Tax=Tricholomella constricta TaxID=117010 RepID=A0A8H5HRR4_9AGAR|nr:hypothetical protein D9615_000157 [Tricholomella constricta]
MMTFRWSWIFILYSLLVRLGSATVPDDNHIVDDIHRRAGAYESNRVFGFMSSPPEKPNIAAIVGGVIGGVVFTLVVLGWCFVSRKRRISHVEEGAKGLKGRPDGWIPDLKSEFSPDEKNGGKFDRIRDALARRGVLKKSRQSILPIFQVALPPGSTDSIDRPPPAVPNHVPRYPSVLERGYTKRRPTPPSLEGYPDLSRTASVTDSIHSTDSGGGGDRPGRRKVQVPPKALMVPIPGRPLPGLSAASAKSAGLRPPKSPSRRRSWFSKHPFKHPFIPIRNVDNTLRFPPGSPLHPGLYQPSRQHLEARMEARSPRIESMSPRSSTMSARHMPMKSARRQPVPLYEDSGSSKQARLMDALSAGLDGPRTPVQNGSRTAVPPNSSRHPLGSSRFLPEPPTTSYI